ncbi:MAG: DUF423 domain-containing protein [Sphingobacteriaceae bacterium]|jgi:uncharacterized membrane protein YgdD (TMEM256/DUF423 family)|nr:MAG: DUF423 domain-containing protein [Pedobacter sp.]
MNKKILITASTFGVLAVSFGAFGAHVLKSRISFHDLELWKTAVDYQFYHTLGLLFLATIPRSKGNLIKISAWLFTLGILLFSGSLYLMAIKNQLTIFSTSVLGPATPIGGLFFILGWIGLLFTALRKK